MRHLFKAPARFTREVDEELYPAGDAVVAHFTLDLFLAMPEAQRVIEVRALVEGAWGLTTRLVSRIGCWPVACQYAVEGMPEYASGTLLGHLWIRCNQSVCNRPPVCRDLLAVPSALET